MKRKDWETDFKDSFYSIASSLKELEEKGDRQRRKGKAFTVFGALGCTRDELSHSTFLASLLDPDGDHGQGVRFLEAFLDICRKQAKGGKKMTIPRLDEAASSYRWLTRTEHFAPVFLPERYEETRRSFLDITVRCPKAGFFLAIENKVRAVDGEDQLWRYAEFLQRRKDRYPNQMLVYLTPEGRPSPSARGCAYVALSYKGLAAWLDRIEREAPPRLRPILAQYRRTVKRIAPDVDARTQHQKDMIRFLLEPDNLQTALKIEEHLPEVRKELLRRFWGNVRSRLEAHLETHDASGWLLKSREKTDGKGFADDNGGLKIIPAGTGDRLCLAFNIEQGNNGDRRLRYGLWPHPWTKREGIDNATFGKFQDRLRPRLGSSLFKYPSHGWALVQTKEKTKVTENRSLTDPAILLGIAESIASGTDGLATSVANEFAKFFFELKDEAERMNKALLLQKER